MDCVLCEWGTRRNALGKRLFFAYTTSKSTLCSLTALTGEWAIVNRRCLAGPFSFLRGRRGHPQPKGAEHMICDRIENASTYYCLGPRFEKALRFLAETDLSGYAVGEHEIEGRDIYLKIQEYETAPPEDCRIEVHEVYADLLYIVQGQEGFGYSPECYSTPRKPYDPEDDRRLVHCEDLGVILQRERCFAIAFPQDAHQSCRIFKEPSKIRKALIKVKL